MKKVLLLANSSKGVYGFRNDLVLELLKKYEVVVSVPDDVCTEELRKEGCKIVKTPLNRRGMNPIEDAKLCCAYSRLLGELKPDVVLTYTIKPNIYGGIVCRIKRIPYITTITGLGSAMEGNGLLQSFTTMLYRVAMKQAACIFFQNETNQRIFDERRIRGKSQMRVSGSGVDLDTFQYMPMPSDDRIRFIFVSRILKEKGIEEYLEAAKQIRMRYPNTEFWVLGKCDDDYEAILQEAHDKQEICYFGMQKDVKHYLKDVHCLVHPSYYPEGMSNVCQEAAACGRAVITTDHTGCRETVDDGVTGYLVEKKNAVSLVTALEQFIGLDANDKAMMGKNARQKMEREFDRKIVTKNYEDVISNTMLQRQKRS